MDVSRRDFIKLGTTAAAAGGTLTAQAQRGSARLHHPAASARAPVWPPPGPLRRSPQYPRAQRCALEPRRAAPGGKVRYRYPEQLRHTFASTMLSRNAPLLYVQQQGGWRSAAVLLRVYARWLPQEAHLAAPQTHPGQVAVAQGTEKVERPENSRITCGYHAAAWGPLNSARCASLRRSSSPESRSRMRRARRGPRVMNPVK